jgi:hypothetical protein
MSVTFDLHTGKALWISIPVMAVMFDVRQTITDMAVGCGSNSNNENEQRFPQLPFVIGPVNMPSKEELSKALAPQAAQMEQLAKEMEALSENAQEMDYAAVEKWADSFEKQFDTGQMVRAMTAKMISPDLKVSGGNGKTALNGGGTLRETEAIDHGSKQTIKEFRWHIIQKP